MTVVVFALAGCLSQPAPPTNYYILEFDGSVAGAPPEAAAPGRGTAEPHSAEAGRPRVVVQDAEVAPMFDRRQLLQRLEGPLVRYRNGDLWAVSPPTAVGDLVREGMARSPRFAAVTHGRDAAGGYQVTTRIEELTHHCCSAEPEVELAGGFALLGIPAGEEIVAHSFTRRETLSDETPRTFVEAVSRILSEELVAFLEELPDELPDSRE